jgi:hypothetical protein
MSCNYYHWDHGYACLKTGNNVKDEIYHKYCSNGYYDYSQCPTYKPQSSSSSDNNCFLTSACVVAMGLPDDCHELTTLRNYRDTYLKNAEGGQCDICKYYEVAPRIVEEINKHDDAVKIWQCIYDELVLPCVKLIEAGKNAEARKVYTDYTRVLEHAYIE